MSKILYACDQCGKTYSIEQEAKICEFKHKKTVVECCATCKFCIPCYEDQYECRIETENYNTQSFYLCGHYKREEKLFKDE